ncbi:MAG: hypothetical protein O8C66_11160 [Candidatus Methanoperedens sp.]|nr:hypothetical protein [Candidatus Methanoperedens sp.]MCZ7371058.1 hypothetical protein [Candidatus Methanoperedens sp.]
MNRGESAQLYTIEGVASALMLVLVIIFVLKAAPLTPNTSSASHQQLEAELVTRGQDLLTILDYAPEGSLNSPLEQAIVGWTGAEFDGQAAVRPLGGATNVTLNVLKEALGDNGVAYDLEVSFYTPSGIYTKPMLWNGKPSDNAVTVSRKLVLHDEDMSLNPELSDIIPDMNPSTQFYNIIDVRLIMWQM